MLKYSLTTFLVLLFFGLNAQEGINPANLFPGDNQFQGWILKDSILSFSNENIYDQVGEASGLYEEFGTAQSFQGIYTNDKATKIQLDIFEMEDSNAAWGIFTMNSSGIGTTLQVGDASILYDYHIHFVKGKYYIICRTSFRDESTIEMITQFALFVADEIPEKSLQPAIMHAFDFKDMAVNNYRYFKGQIALNDIFEFGHGSIAGFDEGSSSRSEKYLFFVFSYSSEKKRREWYASLKGKMDMNLKFKDYTVEDDGITVKDRTGTTFSFKPYKQYILVAKGYSWEEVQVVFKNMKANLDKAIP